MPEVGVIQRRPEFLDRADGNKLEVCPPDEVLKIRVGRKAHPVPATMQGYAYADKWIDVTVAAEGD